MKALSKHYLMELSQCDAEILENVDAIREIITEAAIRANAEVRETSIHRFSPCGISGVVIIAESHLSIHTWPEYDYAAIDIFTCGEHTLPWEACRYISEKLSAKDTRLTVVERGIEEGRGVFGQKIISDETGKN